MKIIDTVSTEAFDVTKGVRQGCILSPMLFNIYVEKEFQVAIQNEARAIKISGRPINNIRYVDNTLVLASTLKDLHHLLNEINDIGRRYSLHINISRTKSMVISRRIREVSLDVQGKNIEQVKRFR